MVLITCLSNILPDSLGPCSRSGEYSRRMISVSQRLREVIAEVRPGTACSPIRCLDDGLPGFQLLQWSKRLRRDHFSGVRQSGFDGEP